MPLFCCDLLVCSFSLFQFLSGFCHFGLVLFMVLWQSPDTPVMSCFHASARLRVCSSRALSRLRALFHVGAWCSDSGTHVLSFGYVTGFGHSRSTFCLLYLVLCGTQLVYSLAACFHVVMSCVNTWLMSFLISCVFMSCFAHGWWFVCWPCACVLCEHVTSVLVFCVPCALMSICLDPTHLVTCLLIHFPQLLSLRTLLVCFLYNLLVFAVLCQFVIISPCVYPVPRGAGTGGAEGAAAPSVFFCGQL